MILIERRIRRVVGADRVGGSADDPRSDREKIDFPLSDEAELWIEGYVGVVGGKRKVFVDRDG